MRTIKAIIDDVIKAEGGYVNDPRDRGGETNWGITDAVARADGYTGAMRDLPRQRAFDIYQRLYVQRPGFDHVATISEPIAAEMVDTGVNMGPVVAARFAQRALNVLSNGGKDYAPVVVDGQFGPASRTALTAFLKKRGVLGEKRLLALLNALQGTRYVELAEGRAANTAFMFGWLARITDAKSAHA